MGAKKLENKRIDTLKQLIRFGLVGLSNTVVNYVVYAIALLSFQHFSLLGKTDYLVSMAISYAVSVFWAYMMNKRFVFRVGQGEVSWWKALLKSYISYAFTGLFLNWLLSFLWVNFFEISKLIAPIINLCITVPLNFILNKFWTFKKNE